VPVFVIYWRDGVPPRHSFALTDLSDRVAVVGMLTVVVALPLLTRRIEQTVREVRQLDAERSAATQAEAATRRVAEAAAAQSASVLALATALATARSVRQVADAALDHLDIPTCPSDGSVALVVDGHLRILASRGANAETIARLERVPIAETEWLRAVLAGEPALIDDRQAFASSNPAAPVLSLYPSGSWAVIPFRYEGTVGLLSVHYHRPQELSALRTYFTLVAEILATSLERALAQEQQAQHLVDLEGTLAERDRIARTLSTTLLPPRLPHLPGFDAAAWLVPGSDDEVAGDFYDLFAVADGGWVAILGDVCGKGAEAAAVTSLARYAARTAALSNPDPTSIAEVANRALTEDPSELFCTMCIARYQPRDATIEVVLAGHPQARMLTPEGVERVGHYSSALGLAGRPPVPDRRPFLVGHTLLLFSDGLVERCQDFEEDALDLHLASTTRVVAAELAAELRTLTESLPASRRDDVAVLAVTCHRAPESA
jgi:sigma-B regulation protein RsbU (phosphoserine phosphatase)